MWAIAITFSPSVNISHFNIFLRNHWANCNQTLVEWSLDGHLPKLCPVIPTSNQDGCQAKNRKKGGWKFLNVFSSETTEPISTKLCWNDSWMIPFQNCVRWSRLPTKMAAKLKIEKRGYEILIVHCCFSVSQNELKYIGVISLFLYWSYLPFLNWSYLPFLYWSYLPFLYWSYLPFLYWSYLPF